jgi:hypothetical protein
MSFNRAALIRWVSKQPSGTVLVPLISFDILPPRENLPVKHKQLTHQIGRAKSITEKLKIREQLLRVTIKLLRHHETISQAHIKLALTSDEWDTYQATLAQKSRGCIKIDIPAKLTSYLKKLENADTAYTRPQDFKEGFDPHAPELLLGYQLAIECLHRTLLDYPELAQFLDRPLCYAASGRPIGNPNNMPRPYSTRSGSKRVTGLRQLKRRITIGALEDSLSAIAVVN